MHCMCQVKIHTLYGMLYDEANSLYGRRVLKLHASRGSVRCGFRTRVVACPLAIYQAHVVSFSFSESTIVPCRSICCVLFFFSRSIVVFTEVQLCLPKSRLWFSFYVSIVVHLVKIQLGFSFFGKHNYLSCKASCASRRITTLAFPFPGSVTYAPHEKT